MARRKFSDEEVLKWQEEHDQSFFYINPNDSNIVVKRRSRFGWTVNLAHPGAWLLVVAIIALVVGINLATRAALG